MRNALARRFALRVARVAAIGSLALVPASWSAAVRTGLDRLAAGEVSELAGKRLGLVAHAASVTRDGRHAIDVLRERKLELVRVFSPEHGLRGRAAAGEEIESGVDAASGLPVVSLYGTNLKPSVEDLAGLDALVVDLQDAGVRFYTYSSTLLLCLEAAAETGIELVVLDRPNPLGGELVAGPVSAPRDAVPASFVNRAPGPLVHGLTLGEMARFVNASLPKPARLSVVEMSGWSRSMTWRDTGLLWVDPSPNLRSPEAAIAYPGVALLEATNISEGRGTDEPFLVFGAPWLDPTEMAVEVPGFRLTATTFTPRASRAAGQPKYPDEACRGFRIEIVDAKEADPYRLGVALLSRLAKLEGFAWRRDGEALTWLLGTPQLGQALARDANVDEILALDAESQTRWRLMRRDALLYD